MPDREITAQLGSWEGYRVGTVGCFKAGELSETPEVLIELIR